MTNIRICSAAEIEFADALRWYAERSVDAALRFDAEFDHILSEISDSPERFPYCDDQHQYHLMRRFPHQIIFRAAGGNVTIIAVAHTSRDPGYWHGR